MNKVVWTFILLFIVLTPAKGQSGDKSSDSLLQIKFDIGLITSESALQPNVAWYPDIVPLGAINLYFPKSKIGVRYRKEFWYRLNRYRIEYATVFQGATRRPRTFWERTSLEIYKTFTLPNHDFTFDAGIGRSRVFPSWFEEVSIEYPVFVSHEIHWFTLELRVSYRPKKFRGRNTDIGVINLSAYYTFPNKKL